MRKTFTHLTPKELLRLTQEQRYHISKLKGKMSLRKIAQSLDCSPSTVSREVRRNADKRGGYSYRVIDDVMLARIEKGLKQGFSPEQITGRCHLEGINIVTKQSTYRLIFATVGSQSDWRVFLRKKKKNKRHQSDASVCGIPNRVDISRHPSEVAGRKTLRHWEADTIVGAKHQGAIMTIVERKSRLLLAEPCRAKAKETADALINQLRQVKPQVKSITYDKGKEFTQHERVNTQIKCQSYFAQPYHSWERGTNKNTNGLLREFFPKKTSLLNVTYKQVQQAVWKLNHRPRNELTPKEVKCLGFKTPWEVFAAETTDHKFNPCVALMT